MERRTLKRKISETLIGTYNWVFKSKRAKIAEKQTIEVAPEIESQNEVIQNEGPEQENVSPEIETKNAETQNEGPEQENVTPEIERDIEETVDESSDEAENDVEEDEDLPAIMLLAHTCSALENLSFLTKYLAAKKQMEEQKEQQ